MILHQLNPDGTHQERILSPEEADELEDQFLKDWNPETMRPRSQEKYLSAERITDRIKPVE